MRRTKVNICVMQLEVL